VGKLGIALNCRSLNAGQYDGAVPVAGAARACLLWQDEAQRSSVRSSSCLWFSLPATCLPASSSANFGALWADLLQNVTHDVVIVVVLQRCSGDFTPDRLLSLDTHI
jgi:hypothetical protein